MAPRRVEPSPPAFLQLAADPVRWRLLAELALSDRRVRELSDLVDRPQNLVSYHLAKLRAEGVVTKRRSAADGRDSYYSLDLERCGRLLVECGRTLHPALRLGPCPVFQRRPASCSRRPRVLFLCTGNSARSQMAEAFVEELAGGAVEAFSAGSHPKPLHPNAVRVMRRRGIDISDRSSKHVGRFDRERFDYVVSLCDRVREVCPSFAGKPELVHWSIPDPSRAGSNDRATLPAFEATAEELEARIPLLLELIAPTTNEEAS